MAERRESVKSIQLEGFSAESARKGDSVHVLLKGNADMAAQDKLRIFLDALSSSARKNRPKEAVFDLAELYFMNSSCLSLLLRFINGVVESSAGDRYTLRFRSNPNLKWQQKSLRALHAYAKDLVVVE
ncbi:MAG TPA: hypothetical protein VHE30_03440 [Polyangiaceae bacterium]|nr:hypothetical protein [Polyangiaceae bacterium]